MAKKSKKVAIGLATIGAVLLPGVANAQARERVAPDTVATDAVLRGATLTLTVDGMVCPFCAYGLEKRLRRLSAVDSVLVRVSDGLVQIREKDGQMLGDERLREEVAKAGFTLREIRRTGSK